MSAKQGKRVVIIGAGVMGLGIGWQLAKAGCAVTICERDRAGMGASWASAGMISPLAEVQMVEEHQVSLGLTSASLYPGWITELERDSGMTIGYRTEGALKVALDRDDARELEHLFETQRRLGLEVRWLSGREARDLEPMLSPRVTAAISCAGDHQVDHRRMLEALIVAFRQSGGTLLEETPVERLVVEDGRARGAWVGAGLLESDITVLAAGCWSGAIDGLPDDARPPVRPVRGQMISVRMEEEVRLGRVIWAPDAYLVPKDADRLFIGSTVEERGFDTRLTAGGLFKILRGAWEALPGIYDLPVIETWAGLRPASRDNGPILGTCPVAGLILATGHYRKGILLAPVTAREIAALVLTGRESEVIAPFTLARFART